MHLIYQLTPFVLPGEQINWENVIEIYKKYIRDITHQTTSRAAALLMSSTHHQQPITKNPVQQEKSQLNQIVGSNTLKPPQLLDHQNQDKTLVATNQPKNQATTANQDNNAKNQPTKNPATTQNNNSKIQALIPFQKSSNQLTTTNQNNSNVSLSTINQLQSRNLSTTTKTSLPISTIKSQPPTAILPNQDLGSTKLLQQTETNPSNKAETQLKFAQTRERNKIFATWKAVGLNEHTTENPSSNLTGLTVPELRQKSVSTAMRVARFRNAMILYDLVNDCSIDMLTAKYSVSAGFIQRLQEQATTFAGIVQTFCKYLDWGETEKVISDWTERASFGAAKDVLSLRQIPNISASHARLLSRAGFKTPVAVANAPLDHILQYWIPLAIDSFGIGLFLFVIFFES